MKTKSKKLKSNFELLQSIRVEWDRNPSTRIHDNSKNKKKDRRDSKKLSRNWESFIES